MKDKKEKLVGKAFVGIDVHKNSWKVCVLGEIGFKKEFSCDPQTKVLVKSLKKLLPNFEFVCAYEAGFSGFWLYDELQKEKNISCIVVNPADIPTSDKERAQKEDKRDARKIASQLKAGSLVGIYVPKSSELGLRELQRLRFSVSRDLVRYQLRIKSFLMRFGIQAPLEQFQTPGHHWSKNYLNWLKSIELSDTAQKFTLNQLILSFENLRSQKKEILLELRKEIIRKGKEEAQNRLVEIEGIGAIVSATILTEVHDIKRFRTNERFHSYIGLVPSTNNSDTTEKIRGITNRSNKRLRKILIESAWVAIRCSPELHHYFFTLRQRMNTQKAIIRVAKKLATKIRYTLLELENKQAVLNPS